MPIAFPEVPDARFEKPPLREVICQVRLPTVLRLATDKPSEIQDAISDRYPLLEVERPLTVEMASAAPQVRLAPTIYRFSDTEHSTALIFTADFYAVSTRAYNRWDQFAGIVSQCSDLVRRIYGVSHAQRVGLRYINHLSAGRRQGDRYAASYRLVNPRLTAMLRAGVVLAPDLALTRVQATLGADPDERLTMLYGLQEADAGPAFVLDFDAYHDGVLPLADVIARCDTFHDLIYRAFRWCLSAAGEAAFGLQST